MVLKENVNAGCVGVFCDAVEVCKDAHEDCKLMCDLWLDDGTPKQFTIKQIRTLQ
jgi:hypothetical protein